MGGQGPQGSAPIHHDSKDAIWASLGAPVHSSKWLLLETGAAGLRSSFGGLLVMISGRRTLGSQFGPTPQSAVSFKHKAILFSCYLCSVHTVWLQTLLGVLFDMCAVGQKRSLVVEERGVIWEDGRPFQSFSIPQRVSDVKSLALSSKDACVPLCAVELV